MDSVRSRSDHASDTREPAPGSKSLFPLYPINVFYRKFKTAVKPEMS
jgi:hypothetical protein